MVYLHIPFCRKRCIYCGFFSTTDCRSEVLDRFTEDVIAEIRARRSEIPGTLGTNTLYIGGGTPSVMPLPFFKAVVRELDLPRPEEFTVEVNPDDIVKRKSTFVEELAGIGVNRISMGIQSLDDGILSWMGRRHDAGTAKEAYRIVRQAGISNVSLDLIFGMDRLTDDILRDTLEQIVGMRPEHISAYQLGIEEDSHLGRLEAEGKYMPMDDESCARQYGIICRTLSAAGYRHYEISNWALPGYEAKHNSAYWKRVPYVGIGPGAHSLSIDGDTQIRSWNCNSIHDWKSTSETLSAEEIREENIMLGLRTAEGTIIDGKRIVIPEEKWFISDSIIEDLI